jgi:acyl carrier protein
MIPWGRLVDANNPTTARICELIGETLIIEKPAPEADLIEPGLIDSLAVMALITAIEGEFEVQLPLEELDADTFRTPARIADFVAVNGGGSG